MRKNDFIKFITTISEEDLRKEMELLYDKYKDVKKHYTMELGSEKDRATIFSAARKTILKSYSRRGYRPKSPKLMKLNNIIKEMETISIFDHELVEFYLFNIETALEFNKTFGYYSEPFENFISRNYVKTLEKIHSAALRDDYKENLDEIVNKLSPKTSFRPMIQGIYDEIFLLEE
jgi:hypothetical protein